MHEDLYPYFERELAYLRDMGRSFAEAYPKVAGRLQFTGDVSADPHVERLIESVALIAARIHHKIDDDFPEITETLLGLTLPHLVRPVPSRTIVQFELDPEQSSLDQAYRVPRGTLLQSPPMQSPPAMRGFVCRFRTAYPVELWPVDIVSARCRTIEDTPFAGRGAAGGAVVTLELACRGDLTFEALGLDRLRLFIDDEPGTAHTLHELLLSRLGAVAVREDPDGLRPPRRLPGAAIEAVGFTPEEAFLDYDARSFDAYRLLHEYFIFPDKFLLVDLAGLAPGLARCGSRAEISLVIDCPADERLERLFRGVDADSFRLGCTPAVNLFRQSAEPIRLTHERTDYPLLPDLRRPWGNEIYSVDRVTLISRSGQLQRKPVPPLHGDHRRFEGGAADLLWTSQRVTGADGGSEILMRFVDRDLGPATATDDVIGVEVTCSNRDLPTRLPVGNPTGDLVWPGGEAPVSRILCLRKPAPPIRPPIGPGAQWRLISHLALNHLSISRDAESLRGLLDLYNLADAERNPRLHDEIEREIAGIVGVESRPALERVGPPNRSALCRGTAIDVTVDESHFVAGGAFLLGLVLERFFALYATANSFTRLTLRSRQRTEPIAEWPPRAGNAPLV